MPKMNINFSIYVVFLTTLLCINSSAATDSTKTTDEKLLAICEYICNILGPFSNGKGCPAECPQRYLGPWSKRSINAYKRNSKRALHPYSDLRGISFDDYGWFMKLLGRNKI